MDSVESLLLRSRNSVGSESKSDKKKEQVEATNKWKRERKSERDSQRRSASNAQVACEYTAVDDELGDEM
jgi:hypothetical protein